MTKKKSTLCLVLITIALAIVCAMSFLSFPIPGTVKDFHSILSNIKLGSDLGGGYYTVYYPDGVLPEDEYRSQYETLPEEDREEFADKYESHGNLYVEKGLITEEFEEDFAEAVDVISYRFEKFGVAGYSVSVQDDYAIRVTLPDSVENADTVFDSFACAGEFSLGAEAGAADIGADRYNELTDYFKGAKALTRDHTPYVEVSLTKTGRQKVYTLTTNIVADSSVGSATLYFNVGSTAIVSLSISEVVDSNAIYVSGYADMETAKIVAVLLDSCIDGKSFDLSVSSLNSYTASPVYGESAVAFLLAGIGLLVLAMAIYSIVRYRGVGAAHLYAFFTYAFAMIIYLAAMNGVFMTASSLLGVLFSAALLVGSNYVVFARAKAEFDQGKTVVSSVKSAYKKTLYPALEVHIALFVIGLAAALIGVTELSLFGIVFAFGVFMSGLSVLVLTRFYWHIMMQHAKNAFKFCNWKREELEDE